MELRHESGLGISLQPHITITAASVHTSSPAAHCVSSGNALVDLGLMCSKWSDVMESNRAAMAARCLGIGWASIEGAVKEEAKS